MSDRPCEEEACRASDGPGGDATRGDPLPRRERGQVLLVGALALAVLLLALVPVYNAVFTTDSADVGGREGVPDGASAYERSTLEAAQRLAIRTGHGRTHPDNGSVASAFEPAFENYTRIHDESAVTGTGTYVNATFDGNAPGTQYGVRVVQNRSGHLDKPTSGGPGNWHLVRNSSRTQLGWFTVRLDVSNLSESDPFVVRVYNGTDEVRLAVESDGGSNDVSVQLTGSVGTMSEDVTCDSRAGEVVIDLYRGSADRGDCTFTGLDVVEGPVSVWVRNGSSAYGVYELVVRNGDGLEPSIHRCTDDHTDPCWTPTLWQLSLRSHVRSGGTDYTSRVNVSVYGEGGA
ncbi:MAG: hypothetical protein V5A62_18085 [Haloarculaceae archaeon]